MRSINPILCAGIESTGQITLSGSGKAKGRVRLPMESFRKGVSAPAEVTRNGVAGFRFDADAESLFIQFCAPQEWDEASDITVILACVLNADETEDDIIDWETSVISVADHEDVDTSGVQTPGASHDIDAFIVAGMLHLVPIILDYDDGTCPIARGDYISIDLSRTANVGNAGYVAGVIVIDICIEYQMDRLGAAV